jgi:hypothetical protein
LSGDLRYCITQANLGGTNTIQFDPTVFATPQTILLTNGQLELSDTTGTMTITGPAAGVTVSGNNASRVFQIDGGVTSIGGLTITGGSSSGVGGGLSCGGTTTLTNCTVSGNSASFAGGGLSCGAGTTTLTNCTISGNSALFGGATLAVTLGSGQSADISTAFAAPLVVTVTANNPSEPMAGGLITPPSSGASATISGSPATISVSGTATVAATANGFAGSYTVSATANGITIPASLGC